MNVTAIIIAAVVIAATGIIVGIGLGLFRLKTKKRLLSARPFQATTAAAADTLAATVWQRPSQRERLLPTPVR